MKENEQILIISSKQQLKELLQECLSELKIENPKEKHKAFDLLTRHEVLDLFDISAVTLRKWVKGEVVPAPVRKGRRLYFVRSEIEKIK